jgi:large subunit ribosomal protein L25
MSFVLEERIPGKAWAKGYVPAVIYGSNVKENIYALIAPKTILEIRKGNKRTINVNINNKDYNVIIQALQKHPISGETMHVDFLSVQDDDHIKVNVKLTFINHKESKFLQSGGKLNIIRKKIYVMCQGNEIIEHNVCDLKKLRPNIPIKSRDLDWPASVMINDNYNVPIVSVLNAKEE